MRAITPAPNLLLIGAPKCGTTSLLLWLRKHPSIYHPWRNQPRGGWESGFLISGPFDFPYSVSTPRGTLHLPPYTDMDHYREEPWVIDKSPQHLYSHRALESVRDLMPEARVVITVRDPYDLLISYYMQMKKTVNYDTTLVDLLSMLDSQDWKANPDIAETWSFLTYPRYSRFVLDWINEIGEERVRIIPLSAIAQNPRGVINDLSDWLGIDSKKMPANLDVKNPRGRLSESPFRKILRNPPNWVFAAARILMPSRALRRTLLDPIRRKGWKLVPADEPEITTVIEETIREKLREEIEFFESMETSLPAGSLIQY